MFDYIQCGIPDKLNRLFTFTYEIHSYTTRSFKVFHIPKVFWDAFTPINYTMQRKILGNIVATDYSKETFYTRLSLWLSNWITKLKDILQAFHVCNSHNNERALFQKWREKILNFWISWFILALYLSCFANSEKIDTWPGVRESWEVFQTNKTYQYL